MLKNAIVVLTLLSSHSVWASSSAKVSVPLEAAYFSGDYDSTHVVKVVVTGSFASTCYRVAETNVRVDAAKETIYVDQRASVNGTLCLQMIVPFLQQVEVGTLPRGNFTVIDNLSGKELGTLPIAQGD